MSAGARATRSTAREPVRRHAPFTDAHFARWLELFTETVDEQFEGPVADLAKAPAAKMAQALADCCRGESSPGDVPIDVLTAPNRRRSRGA